MNKCEQAFTVAFKKLLGEYLGSIAADEAKTIRIACLELNSKKDPNCFDVADFDYDAIVSDNEPYRLVDNLQDIVNDSMYSAFAPYKKQIIANIKVAQKLVKKFNDDEAKKEHRCPQCKQLLPKGRTSK